ncbi:type II toxin-antitoxin system ParD family antitoxin [Tahibacter soli]|jgi:antitoxin ParD1/3/4|uniref:Antitoxin ParD n=1 Tax=Tahibacter soli TaxID=2983605 RepID=A0A9X3YJH5_9GAMM|nr:type II toxin-antitoxin system ParD family antitoxin [Tahibacter soli]MDC8011898.1 type II toxin-antitoxin system ParD family antitoxin [Tahibacter soli]
MATRVEKTTVVLTPEHASAMRSAVASGAYATQSEVVRDAMRLWQEREAKKQAALDRLRQLWDEGIASGSAGELDIETVIKRASEALKKE